LFGVKTLTKLDHETVTKSVRFSFDSLSKAWPGVVSYSSSMVYWPLPAKVSR